ncbi:hypothetical protein AYI70_g3753 [Smittium culicis]|uniref:Thermolabile hemolysin n=1 Tax=Smittium culicis TaxID=133412 RepID=A0A1R1Y213_9FUNG|nr:hypothetical protein AYI70_g3753 [Smittium culicis]
MKFERIKNIVVFGDDSVDFGRTFLENDGRNPNPNDYYYGRFTDGITWSEDFASRIGSHIISYGYGNATSSNTLFEGRLESEKKIAPDIKQQSSLFKNLEIVKSNVLIVGVPSLHCSPYFSKSFAINGAKYSESNAIVEKETELLNNEILKSVMFLKRDRDFISENIMLPNHVLIDNKDDLEAYNKNKLYGCKIPNIWFLDTREFVRENICLLMGLMAQIRPKLAWI